MTKVKAILKNPVLLGMQGFIAGALLFYANPGVLDQARDTTPGVEVALVPPVS